jgi:hypothetical protein
MYPYCLTAKATLGRSPPRVVEGARSAAEALEFGCRLG